MKKVKLYLFTSLLVASGIALVLFSGDKHETQISANESHVSHAISTPPTPPIPPKPPLPPEAPKVKPGA